MQIEAVRPRVTASGRRRLALLGPVALTTKASTAMRPQRHDSLHGRRGEPGQYRCLVRPCVRRGAIVLAIPESPAIEQALDARLHGGQHLGHVQGFETRRRVEPQDPRTVSREHAVQHERVDVDV